MINSSQLLADLQSKTTSRTTLLKKLEDDLRNRCEREPEVDAPLKKRYDTARAKKRTALTYNAWRDEELIQIAVAWVLACVFVRFLEDNGLVEVPKLAGAGERLRRARDEHELFFQRHPTATEREFLLEVFEETGRLPGMKEFFDKKHNPLWLAAPSGDACRDLWLFWQKTNPETGVLHHDFSDSGWDTRFLGDLYQDLSEAARKKYALLQTPGFIEDFILDRTLTPAVTTFGYREVRMIDPTCGSGHFLLGAFRRIYRILLQENPGENPRVLAQKALDAVNGVDLNPFAVAIARFRLLLAAIQVSGINRLKDAPDFQIHLAVGDSLLHGRRFRESEDNTGPQRTFDTEEVFRDELKHHYEVEDIENLHRILGQQYHAVVGNPPYITVKDRSLSELYRARYPSCHRKYSLSVPFIERFFDLAVKGDGTPQKPAGFVGQITSNSFMKREFGKRLVENYLPHWDITHVLDTSGAFIPGHGTPTVILLGKNQEPVASTVRAVMGIKSEPTTPDDPTRGLVWTALVEQVDVPGSESEFLTCANTQRASFHKHPWSIGGGGAAEMKDRIEEAATKRVDDFVESVGFSSILAEDEAFSWPYGCSRLRFLPSEFVRPYIIGEDVRDWLWTTSTEVVFPYTAEIELVDDPRIKRWLWSWRTTLWARPDFSKMTYRQKGRTYWEYHQIPIERNRRSLHLCFPNISTYNNFAIVRGKILFNAHAPILTLPETCGVGEYQQLVAVLNSSVACFWLQQVCHNKGRPGAEIAGADERYEQRYEFDNTKVKQLPIVENPPEHIARKLDQLAQDIQQQEPHAVLASSSAQTRPIFQEARTRWQVLRKQMIGLQEELDWQIYEAFGLVEGEDRVSQPDGKVEVPSDGIELGQRAFEIVLARRVKTGVVQTTWFERHGSTPITEIPSHWPAVYRELVEHRIQRINDDANIRLIERPEYKRRWKTESWDEQFQKTARDWLLARLEGYFHDGARVCDLGGSFDPASHGFKAATRPHLVSACQLADVAQTDAAFMEVAENYIGQSGFSLSKLVRELVESAAVPYLPCQRYKESGLRKRKDWEETWELQRKEDAVEARVRTQQASESEENIKARILNAQRAEVGDIAVPPKYTSADFVKASYWSLRGKLDVPKERWISYPGAERTGDDSLIIAWAGWDHLQRAQALSEYFIDAKNSQGWSVDRLKSLLAGLADLIPWLKQWHNEHDPNLGMGLGDYFAGFLDEQCRDIQISYEEAKRLRFGSSNH